MFEVIIKNAEDHYQEQRVFRIELTYSKIEEYILAMNYITASSTGYTTPSGIYKTIGLNFVLKSCLFNEVRVNNTINDSRLRSNLTNIKFN